MHSEKLKVRAILGPDAASKPRAKKRKRKRFTSRSRHSKEKQRKGSKRRNSRSKLLLYVLCKISTWKNGREIRNYLTISSLLVLFGGVAEA